MKRDSPEIAIGRSEINRELSKLVSSIYYTQDPLLLVEGADFTPGHND